MGRPGQRFQKSDIPFFLFVMIAATVLGKLFQLTHVFLIVSIAEVLVFACILRGIQCRTKAFEQDFLDVNLYMEQILYSFRMNPKIGNALTDVERIFSEGKMKRVIGRAVHFLKTAYTEQDVQQKALQMMEKEYPNQRMNSIHRLMLNVEKHGGEYESAIVVLLADRNIWEKQSRVYQNSCRQGKRNVLMSIVLSSLLCLITPIFTSKVTKNAEFTNSLVYQLSTLLYITLELVVYIQAEKKILKSQQEHGNRKKRNGEELYWKVKNFNKKKEMRTSLIAGTGAALVSAALWITGLKVLSGFMAALSSILFMQHQLGFHLVKKSASREIRKFFPQWITELSLLMQTENVAISIQKSMNVSEPVLQPAIRRLWIQIQEYPESNYPYTEFLKEFSIPEITSAMGMLYAVTQGSGDVQQQTGEILERNRELLLQSESLINEDKMAAMYLLFLVPAFLGMLKMMADMSFLVISYLGSIST
ncbi:MAG: hypothetical protein ACK5ML_10805 [Lachnospiraceae bacterium]